MTFRQDEKRAENREPSEGPVEYAIEGEVIKTFRAGKTIDLSGSGIGIVSDCSLEPGQVIIFRNKDNPSLIRIAVVKWSMEIGDKFRAGLMFV